MISFVLLAVLAQCPQPSCFFQECATPAVPAPELLWGALRPASSEIPPGADSTDFDQFGNWERNPYHRAVAVREGWVYVAAGMSLEIYRARDDRFPDHARHEPLSRMGLVWGQDPHTFNVFNDVAVAPTGRSLTLAANRGGVGLVVFRLVTPSGPFAVYQDRGVNGELQAQQAWAGRFAGVELAVVATSNTLKGIGVYDLDAMAARSSLCLEGEENCELQLPAGAMSGVSTAFYVDGITQGGELFIVTSGKHLRRGVDVWRAGPDLIFEPWGSIGELTNDNVFGVGFWEHEGRRFLMLQASIDAEASIRIYDENLDLYWSGPIDVGRNSERTLTMSTANVGAPVPFAYAGGTSTCIPDDQRVEYLYDLSNPKRPRDVTPLGYWEHYQQFNFTAPLAGVFFEDRFYRAANTVFDAHVWRPADPIPDPAIFADGFETGDVDAWSSIVGRRVVCHRITVMDGIKDEVLRTVYRFPRPARIVSTDGNRFLLREGGVLRPGDTVADGDPVDLEVTITGEFIESELCWE